MKLTRITLAVASVLFALSGAATAAEELFAPASNRSHISNPGELLQQVAADPANERIEIVAARADLIAPETAEIALSLPGGIRLVARQTDFQRMESGNDVWTGQIQMDRGKNAGDDSGRTSLDAYGDNLIAVRSGDTILATIRIAGELYRLVPIEDGAHALVEVDQTRFQPDEDEIAYAEMMRNSAPVDLGKDVGGPKAISTIRVLVAFGAAASSAVGNEQQAIDLSFSEANSALAATNTDIRFQQAGAIQFYSQSESTTYSTMLSRLTNGSDGWYDAIGGQRNTNTADIVAYVAPQSPSLCGQAAGIATSSGSAYFVISHTCLSGNYTFVHEAAHVVGARHDNDGTTTPFSYGHGYVMSSINRRTVMAVNNGPCSTCTRFGAFSSPNYTLSGVTIGTASFNDNTRVWRTRGPTVAAFR